MGAVASPVGRRVPKENQVALYSHTNTSRALRRFYLGTALVFFAIYTAVTRATFIVAVAVLWELVTYLLCALVQQLL